MKILKPKDFVDDYLLSSFFKSNLSPIKILRFDLEKPPKFCKSKMFFYNVYDLNDPNIINNGTPVYYNTPEMLIKYLIESITSIKTKGWLYRPRHFYSPIRNKYTYLRYENIDQVICKKILNNSDYLPDYMEGFKYIDSYNREDYTKYASLMK